MNCKAGDLAIVIAGKYSGKLVSVLYLAPPQRFRLPDGVWNFGEPNGQCWVVEVLGSPVWTPMVGDGPAGRFASYGTASDSILRPLRGESRKNETHEPQFVLS